MTDTNEYKTIAQRYANALLDLTNEKLSKNDLYSQLSDIQTSLNNSDDLQKIMSSPIVSISEKKNILEKLFGANIDTNILNFLKLLLDKNRFSIFNSIVKEYQNEINKQNGILEIKITSAIELNDNERAMVKVKLEKVLEKELELEWDTDKNIIGGLVFKFDDNIIDCSLQHKLQEIKKKITI